MNFTEGTSPLPQQVRNCTRFVGRSQEASRNDGEWVGEIATIRNRQFEDHQLSNGGRAVGLSECRWNQDVPSRRNPLG